MPSATTFRENPLTDCKAHNPREKLHRWHQRTSDKKCPSLGLVLTPCPVDFLREHLKHLRTSNVVESLFSQVRLRTAASRRFKSQVNATCLIWKTMMVAETSFRKLNAPQLVEKVARGTKYDNGKEIRVAA